MEISGRAGLVGSLAVNWSAPPWRVGGRRAVPVGWEREGAALPCGIRRGGGTGGRVWYTPCGREGAMGDELRGCVHGWAERLLPEATRGWVFFPPGDITKSFSCGFMNWFFFFFFVFMKSWF